MGLIESIAAGIAFVFVIFMKLGMTRKVSSGEVYRFNWDSPFNELDILVLDVRDDWVKYCQMKNNSPLAGSSTSKRKVDFIKETTYIRNYNDR